MTIPFIDLKRQYDTLEPELQRTLRQAIHEFNFIRGRQVSMFEDQFKKILEVKNCIATGNCTDALFTALKSLGVKPGDEIITPAFSWIASAQTISLCGATPVFVDVDEEMYTLDPALVEEKITPKTRGVIVVHLYGQAAQATQIKSICAQHQLFMIEDCAQAHLTKEAEWYAGVIGDVGAFSFYPTKNLGAYGDAGCIVTHDDELAVCMRRFANNGALVKDDHEIEGSNSRMDTLQASILLTKLPFLEKWNARRKEHAKLYSDLLSDIPEITIPHVRPGTTHTFHIYAIRARQRNELKDFLANRGIQTMIHYPKALPNLPAYNHLHHRPGDFPVASQLESDILSLPIYPELSTTEIAYVCDQIKDFYTLL